MNESNKKNDFSREELKQRLQQLEAEIQAKEAFADIPLSKVRKNNWKVCFLAVLPMLVIAGYFLHDIQNKKLFSRYYAPYPNVVGHATSEKVFSAGLKEDAFSLYERGHYEDALEHFERFFRLGKNQPDILFYAGISCIEINQLDKAEAYMQEVLSRPDNTFFAQAEWYLALIHLKKSESRQARKHLELLAQSTEFYKEKASLLLNEL